MKCLGTALLGAAGILALSVTGASAAIVCNAAGDCWHVKQAYDYPPDVRVHVYGDDWKWADADADRYHWREHEGRGYWRGAFGSVSKGKMRLLRLKS
jgi:hypothetical protein